MRSTLNPSFHRPLSVFGQSAGSKFRQRKDVMMFLKKVEGPRKVTLPDGTTLSRGDLPPADTLRWVASRKAVVVKAVLYGLAAESEMLERYGLSAEEFGLWRDALRTHGDKALKVTTIQRYRHL
jgi:Protein of unknown function (DUF1153)